MAFLNNILITGPARRFYYAFSVVGTPCCGKSTLAKKVANDSGWEWINISELAIKENLINSFDTTLNCPVIDEDKVVAALSSRIKKGSCIVEYHGCGFLPDHWFHSVFVLRAETSYLYDRLVARGYTGRKLNDNIESEIFQVILEEARETFDQSIIHELQNNTMEDLENNLSTVLQKL